MLLVSIVLKILNEEDNIGNLLDSLVIQEPPIEIVIVDGGSKDRTLGIISSYMEKHDFIRLFVRTGGRGVGLNYGLGKARGEIIALTDGDCIANPNWISEIRKCMEQGAKMMAGKSINVGLRAWEELDRVELFYRGMDCTWPGCNLAFRREVYETVGGVDTWFTTAEDIDFNFRAIQAGYEISYNPRAIIYNRTRATVYGFIRQAFWNGAGRKQLTLKHGRLWSNYDPLRMFKQKMTFWAMVRLCFAMLGYLGFKFFGDRGPYQRGRPNPADHR